MKKKLCLLSSAFVLLAIACQQDELPVSASENNYISFAAPTLDMETSTRSHTQDALAAGDKFGVLGYCVPYELGRPGTYNYNAGTSVWLNKYGLCPPSVFYNEPVTVGGIYCTYENLKQWYMPGKGMDGLDNAEVGSNAEQYRYTFFAYYPYLDADPVFSVDSPTDAATAGAPKFTFTMPQSGSDVNSPLDHNMTPDAMFAVLFNRQKMQGSLTFTFSHMLTALGFEVNNFSEYDLQVHSIKLSGQFFKQIVLDFTGSGTLGSYTFPEQYYRGAYTVYDETAHNGQPLSLPAPADGEERSTSGLLPQNADGTGEHILLISGSAPYFGPVSGDPASNPDVVHVSIDYTFSDGTIPARRTAVYGRPTTFTPTAGTKYTAQLNFVGNAFVLQFVVDNNETWEDGGSDNDDVIFE